MPNASSEFLALEQRVDVLGAELNLELFHHPGRQGEAALEDKEVQVRLGVYELLARGMEEVDHLEAARRAPELVGVRTRFGRSRKEGNGGTAMESAFGRMGRFQVDMKDLRRETLPWEMTDSKRAS